MASPLRLRNPLAIASLAGVAVARGAAYLLSYVDLPEWLGDDLGPNVPLFPLWVAGLAWVGAGILAHVALFVPSLFRPAIAFMTGLYTVWALVYAADMLMQPDLNSLVGLAIYIALVPVTITLGQEEIYARFTCELRKSAQHEGTDMTEAGD